MVRRRLPVLARGVELALIVLGVAVFFFGDGPNAVLLLGLWDLAALGYLITRIRRLRRSIRPEAADQDWLRDTLGGRSGLLFTLFASLTGIGAGLAIVIGGSGDPTADGLKAVAVCAVLLAWGILHFGYAERYARDYYAALPEEILSFPKVPNPTFVDFAYFSFTLGTSFAVSDVETTGSAIRLRVFTHSVLSFFYNTATLGLAVGVITGK